MLAYVLFDASTAEKFETVECNHHTLKVLAHIGTVVLLRI